MNKEYYIFNAYPNIISESSIEIAGLTFSSFDSGNFKSDYKSEIENFLERIHLIGDRKLVEDNFIFLDSSTDNIDDFQSSIKIQEQILFFLANFDGAFQEPSLKFSLSYSDRHGNRIGIDETDHYLFPTWSYSLPHNRYELPNNGVKIFEGIKSTLSLIGERSRLDKSINTSYEFAILDTIAWFNKAKRSKRIKDESASIVFFAAAFESFFEMPRNAKKEAFSYAIQRYLGPDKKVKEWSENFYDTRSRILHGGAISPELYYVKDKYHVLHTNVAQAVLIECIMRQLHITDDLYYPIEIRKERFEYITHRLLVPNVSRFETLLDRKRFNFNSISQNLIIANSFFENLFNINIYEPTVASRKKIIMTNYKMLLDCLKDICIEWISRVVSKSGNELTKSLYISKSRGIKPVDALNKVKSNLEKVNNDTLDEDLYAYWYDGYDLFANTDLRVIRAFNSANSEYNLFNIFEFVFKSFHLLFKAKGRL